MSKLYNDVCFTDTYEGKKSTGNSTFTAAIPFIDYNGTIKKFYDEDKLAEIKSDDISDKSAIVTLSTNFSYNLNERLEKHDGKTQWYDSSLRVIETTVDDIVNYTVNIKKNTFTIYNFTKDISIDGIFYMIGNTIAAVAYFYGDDKIKILCNQDDQVVFSLTVKTKMGTDDANINLLSENDTTLHQLTSDTVGTSDQVLITRAAEASLNSYDTYAKLNIMTSANSLVPQMSLYSTTDKHIDFIYNSAYFAIKEETASNINYEIASYDNYTSYATNDTFIYSNNNTAVAISSLFINSNDNTASICYDISYVNADKNICKNVSGGALINSNSNKVSANINAIVNLLNSNNNTISAETEHYVNLIDANKSTVLLPSIDNSVNCTIIGGSGNYVSGVSANTILVGNGLAVKDTSAAKVIIGNYNNSSNKDAHFVIADGTSDLGHNLFEVNDGSFKVYAEDNSFALFNTVGITYAKKYPNQQPIPFLINYSAIYNKVYSTDAAEEDIDYIENLYNSATAKLNKIQQTYTIEVTENKMDLNTKAQDLGLKHNDLVYVFNKGEGSYTTITYKYGDNECNNKINKNDSCSYLFINNSEETLSGFSKVN